MKVGLNNFYKNRNTYAFNLILPKSLSKWFKVVKKSPKEINENRIDAFNPFL